MASFIDVNLYQIFVSDHLKSLMLFTKAVATELPVDFHICNLIDYSTATCNMTATYNKSAVGLVETY